MGREATQKRLHFPATTDAETRLVFSSVMTATGEGNRKGDGKAGDKQYVSGDKPKRRGGLGALGVGGKSKNATGEKSACHYRRRTY